MSKRLRVLPYKMGSKSSRDIASYLGCKKIYNDTRSKFIGKPSDIVINWGSSSGIQYDRGVSYINHPNAVHNASNKLSTLKLLDGNVSIPNYYTTLPSEDGVYVARTILSGHSGNGIVVGTKDELPYAPLYTQYIEKVAEYRVIVVGNTAVDVKQKLKKKDWNGERDKNIWNHSNGYTFARNDITIPDSLLSMAITSVHTLGLDFGAVDIIMDEEGTLYVLEVNTAFGIEGQTLSLVGDALKEMLC